ncbi:hypothetical protein GCM10027445_40050 [Amycolatopsis endophytica]|uniref:Uncharacterized protein n=1 Tax=Amycolatopsis endophytica TaxID=860233 RepID=A0A853B7N8_9PSEU|nr:hypothetical protein [Amycolatopsis endophytica]NYI90764.1 hypothetical protein [Amycolatopsis endophytica]
MVLLLGDEQPHRRRVGGITGPFRGPDEVRAVAGFADLEPLQAAHHGGTEPGAACPVRITIGAARPRGLLEFRHPSAELRHQPPPDRFDVRTGDHGAGLPANCSRTVTKRPRDTADQLKSFHVPVMFPAR